MIINGTYAADMGYCRQWADGSIGNIGNQYQCHSNTNVIPGYQGNQECNVSQDKDEDPW